MAKDDEDILEELHERYDYANNTSDWADIRKEAEADMAFVGGDPWTPEDKAEREKRPMVAPEEMGQYFNQVINQLRSNPRGMKFSPNGNGANDAGARFYQNKARETEYRSHATIAYIAAAENAIQRSYGFLRVDLRYQSPRSANQEIWIEPLPDPDMVLPDPDAKRPDSSDMRYCFVHQWEEQREFKRKYPGAKVTNFDDFASTHTDWVQGNKVLTCEYWVIDSYPRKLLLVQPPAMPARPGMPPPPPSKPLQVFEDELLEMPIPGTKVIKELRTVDYPQVMMYLSNGLEILHRQTWPGKYIPIVSCYGKVLYITAGGQTKRKILSMTRFGRDPWKCLCYAASQELELLAMVPKSPIVAYEGQITDMQSWQDSFHVPKVVLLAKAKTAESGDQVLPLPQRANYIQAENLQALQISKESWRRAIQAAMGSNFLPTQQQKGVDRHSGDALDKIDATQNVGTFHFVDNYDHMIRQVAVIYEDLCDKVYDYQGETSTMEADGNADSVPINDPQNKDAISTKGDYLVTVSTGPSSDSERDSAEKFIDTLVDELPAMAQIAGPQLATKILAQSIRFRNGGPQMDKIADLLDPPPPPGADGKPIPPELQAAHGQIQQLQQQLQQAQQVIQTKQVEQQGKITAIDHKGQIDLQAGALDRETKLAIAEIQAQAKQALQDMALFYEERARIGAQVHEHAMGGRDIAHNVALAKHTAAHESIEKAKDRIHERNMAQHAAATGAVQAAIAAKAKQQPTNGGGT